MEHKEGLKPCPFCGRTNQRFLMDMDIYNYPQNKGRRAIICDCGLRLYASDHGEAEKKWQNRLYDEFIKELASENERLKTRYVSMDNLIIAETVRKMQERLKEHLEKPEFPWDSFTVAEEVIDQIAKEMLEGG